MAVNKSQKIQGFETLSEGQQKVVLKVIEGSNVFFTGAAGTGKSFLVTFLLNTVLRKRYNVYKTASTGAAAMGIGGNTIHSFAGIGIGQQPAAEIALKMSRARKTRIQGCEILFIDEMSMLSGNILGLIDEVFQRVRACPMPMGGIQVVACGDFLQLPPVNTSEKFAFDAPCFDRIFHPVHGIVVLDKVYRQDSGPFLEALSKARVGICDPNWANLLNGSEYKRPPDHITPVQLHSVRRAVDVVNEEELAKIPGRPSVFKAKDSGNIEQLERSCIAPSILFLKVGAQVMAVKNISEQGIFNGMQGCVVAIDEEAVLVKVRFNDGSVRELTRHLFELSEQNQVIASREQVPLIMAWAITIHKCQGMTLDYADIHLKDTFEYGQAYAALSRVRSVAGMRVTGFAPEKIRAHPAALKFYADRERYVDRKPEDVPQ